MTENPASHAVAAMGIPLGGEMAIVLDKSTYGEFSSRASAMIGTVAPRPLAGFIFPTEAC